MVDIALVEFLDLKDEIAPLLSRCPEASIERALRRAAREFCRSTTVWRHTCPPQTVEADKHTYRISPPMEAMVVRVHQGEYLAPGTTKAKPIYPRTEEQLNISSGRGIDYHNRFTSFLGSSDWKSLTGQPHSFIHHETADHLRLYPIPTSNEANADALTLYISAMPSRTGKKIPDWIANRYYETLEAGAMANLLGMADESWSDARGAQDKKRAFEEMTSTAAADVLNSHSKAPQTVEPRYPLNG